MSRASILLIASAAALLGCMGSSKPIINPATETELEQSERSAHESHTLSNLATLENAMNDYVSAQRQIPEKLELLTPKYIAEIPPVELGIREHRDTTEVQPYPSEIIRDGAINGMSLKDTGRWGYVYNNHQVIIFVDCTHPTAGGQPWYQQRGIY